MPSTKARFPLLEIANTTLSGRIEKSCDFTAVSRLEFLTAVITQCCPAAQCNHQCSRYHLSEGCVHVQLEFDDVFLVDFFKNSPAGAEWRVLLWYLERLNGKTPDGMQLVHVRVYSFTASQRAV